MRRAAGKLVGTQEGRGDMGGLSQTGAFWSICVSRRACTGRGRGQLALVPVQLGRREGRTEAPSSSRRVTAWGRGRLRDRAVWPVGRSVEGRDSGGGGASPDCPSSGASRGADVLDARQLSTRLQHGAPGWVVVTPCEACASALALRFRFRVWCAVSPPGELEAPAWTVQASLPDAEHA